ncbi:MAG: long-chain fatty acid--CoA ligase [Bacteroidetes bacterium]|nr:MAG: long-chain fatty acid--CoA ligase [Bacteroidota bacterium]
MKIERLFDFLEYYKNTYPQKQDALASKIDGEWVKYSITEYTDIVRDLAYGLINLGVKKGDKIASISPNAPEWNFIDMAVSSVGAIHVPIYPTISSSDYEYIFNHAEVSMVFISGKAMYNKIVDILPKTPTVSKVYSFTDCKHAPNYKEVIELGQKEPQAEKLKIIQAGIVTDELATIIYTSGTTGIMKGVMLSHNNLISNALATSPVPQLGVEHKALSFLPLCHVYERMLNYMEQYNGISIYYAENMAKIIENIQELKVDMMSTVPRLLEKVYDKIVAKGEALDGFKRKVFDWALELGFNYDIEGNNTAIYNMKLAIADKLVFSKWREAFGGNMSVMVSGGAALQTRLGRIFWAAGIPVVEGYGLTETSPVISVNTLLSGELMIGTVGVLLPEVEVKIAEDGEILSKGPNLMLGYYKEKALTEEVIVDGWFHTGDLGELIDNKFLKITGRKKDNFKTSMGKYVAPGHIEETMKESSFIDMIVVVGENQKFAAALIVPNFEHIKDWCSKNGKEALSNEQAIDDADIKKAIKEEIAILNTRFGSHEQVKQFRLIADEWTVESGFVTAKMSIKRSVVTKAYQHLVDDIFK